jgi:hypothetical protein
MDRTVEFWGAVSRAYGSDGEGKATSPVAAALVLQHPFHEAALHLHSTIQSMEAFVASQETGYLNIHKHISFLESDMSDVQRDQLEEEVSAFAKSTDRSISALDGGLDAEALNNAAQEHQRRIVIALYRACESVTKLMQSMRDQRTRQLQQELEFLAPRTVHTLAGMDVDTGAAAASDAPAELRAALAQEKDAKQEALEEEDGEGLFSAEERQEFALENQALLKELEDNLGQLKKAEKRMLEVSSLLSVFSAKVLEQEEQIDAIYDSSVKSVTYLKGSHHELRQALRHGQASRFGVFFFLVSASLSLLFLDWYSQ